MKFEPTPLPGSFVVEAQPNYDSRGWFARLYCKEEFNNMTPSGEWVQINHSYTKFAGTIRGMHFQKKPFREAKMVKCISGEIFDVIIDLRENSVTFLKWFGIYLSSADRKMIYIPEGFAHGFQCITDNCELIYFHSEYYKPGFEDGILHDDPLVGIEWPLDLTVISEKDSRYTLLTNDFRGV